MKKSQIPPGTAYIVYEGTEHLGSGGAYFGMYDFSMIFYDGTAPSVVSSPYFYAVNGSTTLPEYVVPGDKVTYAMKFSEAVTVTANPTLDLSIGDDAKYEITYSSNRQTVYFTVTLENIKVNRTLTLEKISGLSVKDDAGNVYNYTKSNLSVGSLPYKSVFSAGSTVSNLRFTGTNIARYKEEYSAFLIPDTGYKLPGNITVKVNGTAISDYTYNKSTGRVAIADSAVIGNVEISASGVPQTYTVYFYMLGGRSKFRVCELQRRRRNCGCC